ncbi:MAG: universal stress protein [Proteobacteria bacterium]|nr:universal stress protein [Pseudomonadota bacterium]
MTNQDPLMHMLVGFDFSATSQLALSRAIEMAETESRHMLHVLSVLDHKNDPRPEGKGKHDYEGATEVQEQLTSAIEERLKKDAPSRRIKFFVHVHIGKPAESILSLAEEVGASLILVGSHGRTGIRRMVMGSVSEQVVRAARCSVLVVREREYEDVELETIVKAPEGHAEERYVRPHRYAYFNQLMERERSSWPWY